MSKLQKQSEQHYEEPDNEFIGNRQQHEPIQVEIAQEELANLLPIKQNKPIISKTKKQDAKKYVKGVEDNPEYFRVDFEITHKLYEIYRRLKIVTTEQSFSSSFEEKEQGNNTVNYHKIMQIFKDIGFKLEINQKLQILRAIKKFCFNQNFINEEQFIKIFKVIVHGIGVKEIIFKPLIANKYASIVEKDVKNTNHKKTISIKINKNFGKKLKTEPQMEASQLKSQFTQLIQQQKSFQSVANADNSYLRKIPTVNPSVVIEESTKMQESRLKSGRRHESRRRMITDASRYDAEKGYLNRAIQKNKLGKLTWENLFKMTEDNMHHNIVIPSFVSQDINLNDFDL